MALAFEDVKVLQPAESIAAAIRKEVIKWNEFARDVIGKQSARAADSIGANIAESFGRFNYGEKVTFLYYARGSLFETKFWLNRASKRDLMNVDTVNQFVFELTSIARQLNSLAASTKRQRSAPIKSMRESQAEYFTTEESSDDLFTALELEWLAT